jgi:hypothetical protein
MAFSFFLSRTSHHGQSPLFATRSDETSGEFFSCETNATPSKTQPAANALSNARKREFLWGGSTREIQMKIAMEKSINSKSLGHK